MCVYIRHERWTQHNASLLSVPALLFTHVKAGFGWPFLSFDEKSVGSWLCEKEAKNAYLCVRCVCVFILFSVPALLNYGWIVANKQNRWDAVIILTTNGFDTHKQGKKLPRNWDTMHGNGYMLKSMQFKCVNYGMYECWICVRLYVYFGCLVYCYTV